MKKGINPKHAPKPTGPYSQAIMTESLLFCSGQIAKDPETGKLLAGSIQDQTKLIMRNFEAILSEAGCGFDDVLKATVYLKDMASFKEVNEVYSHCFNEPYPARSKIQVAALPLGADVEIELIAKVGSKGK